MTLLSASSTTSTTSSNCDNLIVYRRCTEQTSNAKLNVCYVVQFAIQTCVCTCAKWLDGFHVKLVHACKLMMAKFLLTQTKTWVLVSLSSCLLGLLANIINRQQTSNQVFLRSLVVFLRRTSTAEQEQQTHVYNKDAWQAQSSFETNNTNNTNKHASLRKPTEKDKKHSVC